MSAKVIMQAALRSAIEQHLKNVLGTRCSIVHETTLGGGCINHVARLDLATHPPVLAKWNQQTPGDMFEAESLGLQALGKSQSIRVPRSFGCGGGADVPAFLLTEYIEPGQATAHFARDFGRQLAEMHRRSTSLQYGFECDNYLGSTPQPNPPCDEWEPFFRRHRIEYQLELAASQSMATTELMDKADRLIAMLPQRIGEQAEPPVLIHGDLWSGNFLVDTDGQPVIIDPAAYYADREAEFGMTLLFGGLGSDFYAAYDKHWPLRPGWRARALVYKLYHLLNHLNLFGRSYLDSCLRTLDEILSQNDS